jgi:hypothetical protein
MAFRDAVLNVELTDYVIYPVISILQQSNNTVVIVFIDSLITPCGEPQTRRRRVVPRVGQVWPGRGRNEDSATLQLHLDSAESRVSTDSNRHGWLGPFENIFRAGSRPGIRLREYFEVSLARGGNDIPSLRSGSLQCGEASNHANG